MFIVPLYCCQNLTSFTHDVQQWLRMDHTRGSGNWITVITERSMWTHFDGLRTKRLLKIFTTFWYVISKKRKKCFLKSEKIRKIRVLELCQTRQHCREMSAPKERRRGSVSCVSCISWGVAMHQLVQRNDWKMGWLNYKKLDTETGSPYFIQGSSSSMPNNEVELSGGRPPVYRSIISNSATIG